MTRPAIHDLPPSSKVDIASRALALQGQHGTVSKLAQEYTISRQKVYDLRKQGQDALTQSFTVRETRPGSFTMEVSEADIARTVIALRVTTPSSIRDEEAMLPIIYNMGWSYGKIQAVLAEAEMRAGFFLDRVNLSLLKDVALDEMFSQGKPVSGGLNWT